jgi:hypothetical protein
MAVRTAQRVRQGRSLALVFVASVCLVTAGMVIGVASFLPSYSLLASELAITIGVVLAFAC